MNLITCINKKISAISYITSIMLNIKSIPILFYFISYNKDTQSCNKFHITAYLDIVHYFESYFNLFIRLFIFSSCYFELKCFDRMKVLINLAIQLMVLRTFKIYFNYVANCISLIKIFVNSLHLVQTLSYNKPKLQLIYNKYRKCLNSLLMFYYKKDLICLLKIQHNKQLTMHYYKMLNITQETKLFLLL